MTEQPAQNTQETPAVFEANETAAQRLGITPTSITGPQLAAILQGWQGFPQTLTVHHVLIMLNDLGLLGGLTNSQVSQTVVSGGSPNVVSHGKTVF